jgi:transcriptional regulator with XRE-family HTH domain
MKIFNKKKGFKKANLLTSTNKRLKSSREQLGITQDELSKEVGLSLTQIQKYENGNQSIVGKLFKIIVNWSGLKK